jgi:hypothetical protein
MNGLGALLTTLIALGLIGGSRGVASASFVAAVLYLPQQQSLDIGGLTITALRMIEVIGFVRICLRGETRGLALNRIDKAFFATYAYAGIVFLLRSSVAQAETVGWACDTMLCYLVFRCLIRSDEDLRGLLRSMAILMVPYVALLTIEMATGTNPFSALGTWTSWVELREGRVRAMGSFRNPSLLGTFGACFLPLYVALLREKSGRRLAVLGASCCAYIVYAANSGGPISAMGAGLLGCLLWRSRRHMRLLRITAGLALVGLAMVMQAPIWSLLERMSFITGGSGWHRAHLITMAWQDFDKWWPAGMPLSETTPWFPYTLGITGTADITNAFVDFGLKAGVAAIVIFVYLLSTAFGAIGRQIPAVDADDRSAARSCMLWALGSALAAHVVTWFGITYFDQTFVWWVIHIAAISSLTAARHAAHPRLAAGAGVPDASPQRAAQAPRLAAPHSSEIPL